MIFSTDNDVIVYDLTTYVPAFAQKITSIAVHDNQIISHLKTNNGITYGAPEKEFDLNPAMGASEVYAMLSEWEEDTLFNAFFAKTLEAGNISGGGEDIDKILVKRLGPEDSYQSYLTLGEIPFVKENPSFNFEDHYIQSGNVYLYSIQPVTENGFYGALQKPTPALNTYEYTWIVTQDKIKLEVLDAQISSINKVTKDGIIETIGSAKPFVNRFSNTDYMTFNISGTIASVFDRTHSLLSKIEEEKSATINADILNIIDKKYQDKYGESQMNLSNSMRHYAVEKEFRDRVVSILSNGETKLIKSPTEGLMFVKLTDIALTPIQQLGRVLYTFSAKATEVEEVTEKTLVDFINQGE